MILYPKLRKVIVKSLKRSAFNLLLEGRGDEMCLVFFFFFLLLFGIDCNSYEKRTLMIISWLKLIIQVSILHLMVFVMFVIFDTEFEEDVVQSLHVINRHQLARRSFNEYPSRSHHSYLLDTNFKFITELKQLKDLFKTT